MLFNSEVFLFVFLPLTLAVFYMAGALRRIRVAVFLLVIASLIYYAWWNPAYVPLILGSMVLNYLLGLALAGVVRRQQRRRAKLLLTLGVAGNLGALGYFKYAGFLVANLAAVGVTDMTPPDILLPLAISFFTFQQIAYLADVYQDKVAENNPLSYALFVTFFPQLIAGPIVHHSEMMPQFGDKSIGRFKLANLLAGSAIFFIGLFKKVVIADNIAPFANTVFRAAEAGATVSFADAWAGSLSYSFQIYFDFSGYSDMALGIARMFGICLPINFNSPYKATGIIDFWRRWHMTLSRFLRDYLYIPLGGNRLGQRRRYANMFVVMLLGGLWHGAGWTFVAWGALHGLYLSINHGWRAWRGEARSDSVVARASATLLTFVLVVFAWVFFRAESFASALTIVTAMVSPPAVSPRALLAGLTLDREIVLRLALLGVIVAFLPNTQQFMRRVMDPEFYRIRVDTRFTAWLVWGSNPASACVVALFTALAVMSLWQPSEFLYYQF
ncbi:MAG: MBOAT family protein [Gammaproteobacteria bacterium]|nr:MBOAT family protein [Gammaproteobacteria bacterium]NND53358.1 MBOAT family protein [Gammaproteobacteria bacterium]